MEHLSLANNLLTGSIPPVTSTNGRLKTLRLTSNRLTGRIPESISSLKALSDLDLADNSIVGTIPSSLGDMRLLETLALRNRDTEDEVYRSCMTGTIPSTLSRLTNLKTLDLGYNHLTGTIPVLNQINLKLVYLEGNYLTMGSLQEVPMSTFAPDARVSLDWNCLVFRNVRWTHCKGK